MDLKPKNGIELWWGTPFFVHRWPQSEVYNLDLKSYIVKNQDSLSTSFNFDLYNGEINFVLAVNCQYFAGKCFRWPNKEI